MPQHLHGLSDKGIRNDSNDTELTQLGPSHPQIASHPIPFPFYSKASTLNSHHNSCFLQSW